MLEIFVRIFRMPSYQSEFDLNLTHVRSPMPAANSLALKHFHLKGKRIGRLPPISINEIM